MGKLYAGWDNTDRPCVDLKPIDIREKIMTENKYRVVLTGELAEGKSEDEVAARMAALFKTSPDKIGMLLKKQGTVIKKDINLATAKKYAGAILSTGAVCKIDSPEQEAFADKAEAPPGEVAQTAEVVATKGDNRAEPRVVVILLSQKPEERFAPVVLGKISGTSNGINLDGANAPEVSYDQIMALATFAGKDGAEEKTKLLVFTRESECPFVCDIDHIVYSDFPIKVFPKNIVCFRGFLHFLCKENPSIIIEESTLDFLSGSQPQILDPSKAMKLATGMGLLIESGDIDAQT